MTVAQGALRFETAGKGLTGQVSRLTDAVVDFAATVREAAAEREDLLRSALGVDVGEGGTDPEQARHLLEHPETAAAQ